jgi:hypothetical protein
MPVEPVVDHPIMATANILVRGAVWSIVTAWWRGGCRPLPTTDVDLMVLAGCDTRRWYDVREAVNRVLGDTLPKLASAYAGEATKAVNRKRAASIAATVKNAMPRARIAPIDAEAVSVAGLPLSLDVGTPMVPPVSNLGDGWVREQRGPREVGHSLPRTHDYGGVKQGRHLERFGLKDKPAPLGSIVEPRRR